MMECHFAKWRHTVTLLHHYEARSYADHVMLSYLQGEIQYQDLREHVKLEEQKWIRKAKRYSLYDDQPYRIK